MSPLSTPASAGLHPAGARPKLWHSLSLRLIVLLLAVLALLNVAFFVPNLLHERRRWLREHEADARLIALAFGSPGGVIAPSALRSRLELVSGLAMVRLLAPNGPRDFMAPVVMPHPGMIVDLDRERWDRALARAVGDLAAPGDTQTEYRFRCGATRLEVLVGSRSLHRFLARFCRRFLLYSATLDIAACLLLFFALRWLMVLPLRLIAQEMTAFGADPQRRPPLDPARAALARVDEVAMLARTLADMQAELRTALWRNARLAAVGSAMARMSHDLRGVLASAMLVADRLSTSRDDAVRNAGEVIVRSVNRATAIAQRTLDFVREGPPPALRRSAALHTIVDEAAQSVGPEFLRSCTIRNGVPEDATGTVDQDALTRALANLIRNAAQAGARTVNIGYRDGGPPSSLLVADDGPGLPEDVRDRLFHPFVTSRSGGSGLGLAIARDLMLSSGGDLCLSETGPQGTTFELHLQQPRRQDD
jgi:signal transduction histidine kinase